MPGRIGTDPMLMLQKAKSAERQEAAFLVIRNDVTKRVAVAWTLYQPQFNDSEAGNETPQQCLQFAWRAAPKADMDRLALLADVSLQEAAESFERLVSAGLIYPDGTAHGPLMALIRAEVGTYISSLVMRKQPPAKKQLT